MSEPQQANPGKRQLPVRAAEISAEVVGIIGTIDASVMAFSSKRTTLEEEAICRHLNELASIYSAIICCLHEQAAHGVLAPASEIDAVLCELNADVQTVLHDLTKAIAHSFNYVEQYFEYDFYARLTDEHRFTEKADKIRQLLAKQR